MSDFEASVRQCYSTWGVSYYDEYYSDKAAYPPVHRTLIREELLRHNTRTLLDAGCGPASILRDLVDLNLDPYGFDLTPGMVTECRKVMSEAGFDENHFWEGSVTVPEHYQNPNALPEYDAAICIGVIPHIPDCEDENVFKNLRSCLRVGGMGIVEARNELFSLFTLNRYSYGYFEEQLIPVDQLRKNIGDEKTNSIMNQMRERFRMDLPLTRKGKKEEPGYDEVLSRTHNPFKVCKQFEQSGFANTRVLFYHYHALPPMFENQAPEAFKKLSLEMELNPTDWRGHFMASAFLITGIAR
jgi:SAM-dependent methyltransferase